MTRPKRHHFLPEFYLKGFARDNIVWLYDRKKNEFRRQAVRNTAVIGDYYTVRDTSGEIDYAIEEFLSQFEGAAKPVIANLEMGDAVTPDERYAVALFIALLFSRTPKFEREAEQIADSAVKLLLKHMIPSVEAAAENISQHSRSREEITPEEFFRFIHEERYHVKGNRNIAVRAMLDQTRKITLDLACMDWVVAHAAEHSAFVTTDSPFGFVVPDESSRSGPPRLGVASQGVIKLIPLSQRIALVLGQRGGGFGHCCFTPAEVRDTNIAVAKECERYVIGHDEALVRTVVCRSTVDRATPGTRMKVDHVPHPTDPMRTFLVVRRVPAEPPDQPLV